MAGQGFGYVYLLVLLTAGLCASLVSGYAFGAPARKCCGPMTPGHGYQHKTEDAPYFLTVSKGKYKPNGNKVEVTMETTGKSFGGFIIEARWANGTSEDALGMFIPCPDTHVMKCGKGVDNALSHSSQKAKTVLTFQWTPPDSDMGEISFIATIATKYNTFYKNIKSVTMVPTDEEEDEPEPESEEDEPEPESEEEEPEPESEEKKPEPESEEEEPEPESEEKEPEPESEQNDDDDVDNDTKQKHTKIINQKPANRFYSSGSHCVPSSLLMLCVLVVALWRGL